MNLGITFYDGIKIEHTQEEIDALYGFLADHHIFAFVELGVHEGGLAYSILTEFPKMHYLGVEHEDTPCSALTLKVAHSKHAQLLTGDYSSAAIITIVDNWISEKWPVFVYCDNPEKIKAIKIYKDLSRHGDYIGIRGSLEEFPVMKRDFRLVKFPRSEGTTLSIYTRKVR